MTVNEKSFNVTSFFDNILTPNIAPYQKIIKVKMAYLCGNGVFMREINTSLKDALSLHPDTSESY